MKIPAQHTTGPWRWRLFGSSPVLATEQHGALFVMDFARLGMQGAQPRFSDRQAPTYAGIMHTAVEIGDINRHPDARLIASSPRLYHALEVALMWMTNANAVEESTVAATVITALRHAGAPSEYLAAAAECLCGEGAANVLNVKGGAS